MWVQLLMFHSSCRPLYSFLLLFIIVMNSNYRWHAHSNTSVPSTPEAQVLKHDRLTFEPEAHVAGMAQVASPLQRVHGS